MKNLPIGVFDSGVGGLTVYKELRALLPGEDLLYFGDTARNPYGSRTDEQIRQFAGEILNFLAGQPVKLAVAACNTITVLGIESLGRGHPFLMLGVSQGVGMALAASRNKRIGVLATLATVRSGRHKAAIEEADPQAQVFAQACPLFAPSVEGEQYDGASLEAAAQEYLKPLKEQKVDTLILACTHYPFLTTVIANEMGPEVTIIDPARETALETRQMLEQAGLLRQEGQGNNTLYFSGDVERAQRIAARMLDVRACQFGQVDVSRR